MKRREKLQMIVGITLMVSVVAGVSFAIISGLKGNVMGFNIGVGCCGFVVLVMLFIANATKLLDKED